MSNQAAYKNHLNSAKHKAKVSKVEDNEQLMEVNSIEKPDSIKEGVNL